MAQNRDKSGLLAAAKEVFAHFSDKDAMTQAAAVAFYAGLSLAPLLTIVALAARVAFGAESKENIVRAFEGVLGSTAAAPIREILNPASQAATTGMSLSGAVSLFLVLLSASGVFGQLQAALNRMWDVRPSSGSGIWSLIRKRLLSVGMLFSLMFLLLVSMTLSAVLQGFIGTQGEGWMMIAVNLIASLLLFTVLFAMTFRFVPDAKIAWSDVWVGGAISAVLFVIGKFFLGLYLGRGSYETSYGAAIGSFVALLVWVYYSSTILFIGAEATAVYAGRQGHPIEPEAHAQVVQKKEVAVAPGTKTTLDSLNHAC